MITDIQRFSIHDGPGIRTTLFVKGCPLHCPWCHNPETIGPGAEVLYYPELCIACGTCVRICPQHNHQVAGRIVHEHAECEACREAARECPTGALRVTGEERESAELVELLLRDRVFFEESNGGVTISGGEPLAQAEFVRQILGAVRAAGIHTCLDTSLTGDYSRIEMVRDVTSLFLVDCKETERDRHLALTGSRLETVIRNLEQLSGDGAAIWLRCPIIPGEHDRREHLEAVGELADRIRGVEEIWLLPFHPTAQHKWAALGRRYEYANLKPPPLEDIERWASTVSARTAKPVRYAAATEPIPARSG
jgi:pyruvate formate lyase activating enzyme